MRKTIFATTTALLLASAGVLTAQDPHAGHGAMPSQGDGQHGMHHCPMHAGMEHGPRAALHHREHLGLSADQVQRLEAVHQRMHEAHQQVMPRMREMHARMTAITEAERFDEAAARAAMQQASQLHTDMMLANLRAQHETRAILTTEQREQLAQYAQQHGGMQHGRMQHGQGQGHEHRQEHRHDH